MTVTTAYVAVYRFLGVLGHLPVPDGPVMRCPVPTRTAATDLNHNM